MVAENTKKIIYDRGLKQKAVAKQAGYTEKHFSNLLNGRLIIRPNDVLRIAKALNVTPNDLFGVADIKKDIV